MSYSAQQFDTAHNIAHVLKDASYFINVIGLALSTLQYNSRLRVNNEMLTFQYEKRKDAEKMKEEFINIAAHEFENSYTTYTWVDKILCILRLKMKNNLNY